MSRALDILQALRTRLTTIRKAAGYTSDAGARVFLGKTAIADNEVPCITILEAWPPEGPSPQNTANVVDSSAWDAVFVAEAVDLCDPDHPLVNGHELLWDMKRALFSGDLSLGRLVFVDSLQPVSYRVFAREPGSRLVVAQLHGKYRYAEQIGNP